MSWFRFLRLPWWLTWSRICLWCGRTGYDPWVILTWRISWTEEPGGLQSMGLQRVRHSWVTNTYWFTQIPWLEIASDRKLCSHPFMVKVSRHTFVTDCLKVIKPFILISYDDLFSAFSFYLKRILLALEISFNICETKYNTNNSQSSVLLSTLWTLEFTVNDYLQTFFRKIPPLFGEGTSKQ